MDLPSPVNYVFVDFENVHEVDLTVIGNKTVSFTLLIGARQTKLDVALVEKLLQHAGSVQLIRLTSSGRNALDFTLAYYVGRAVAADPTGRFYIIAKDTGYDALVEHLRSKHVAAHRHKDCASLPFANAPKPAAPEKTTIAPKAAISTLDERARHVLAHLSQHPKSQPSREKTLIRHVLTLFGNKITDAEAQTMIETLRLAGYLLVNEKGRVTYLLPAS